MLSGAKQALAPMLEGYAVHECSGFGVNPKLEEAEPLYRLFLEKKCNLILAVGGGSVMDMAKTVKFLAMQKKELPDAENIPLVAVPTTAGTGSEATRFAVIYIQGVKHSYADDHLLPDAAVVDARLLEGQSAFQMAVSGADAFAQAVESIWNVNATQESSAYAEKAAVLAWSHLPAAVAGNLEAREKMAEAAWLSGNAINITKTTAPHALSYGFTSLYGLPHGQAVSLFLPFFIAYHLALKPEDCNHPLGADHVRQQMEKLAFLLKISPCNMAAEVMQWLKSLTVEIDFRKLGIDQEGYFCALEGYSPERLKNNPGQVTRKILEAVYRFNQNGCFGTGKP